MGKSKKKKKHTNTNGCVETALNSRESHNKRVNTLFPGRIQHIDTVPDEPYNMIPEKRTVGHRLKWYMLNGKCRFLMTLLFVLMVSCLQAQILEGKVVKVADGDTFTLLVDKEQHRIRLYGIDAPETKGGQPYSQKSKDCLATMIAGKTVTVNIMDTDHYGRYIGLVSTSSIKDVNLEMLKAGMAWHYSYYDKTPAYQKAQDLAKKSRIGLWKDPSPINPYEWRKQKKNK